MDNKELLKLLPTGDETTQELAYRLRILIKYLIDKTAMLEEIVIHRAMIKESVVVPNALREIEEAPKKEKRTWSR